MVLSGRACAARTYIPEWLPCDVRCYASGGLTRPAIRGIHAGSARASEFPNAWRMIVSSRLLTGTFARLAETLALATAGAMIFLEIGFPAALIIGSMLFVAVAALFGRPVLIPGRLARILFVLLGMSLGAVVTPQTLNGIVHWPVSIAIMCISTFLMTIATAAYLRKVHGWDRMSALFGGSPGALAQVMALSIEQKSDVRGIVVVQTVRVVFLTIGVPGGLALGGLKAKPAASLGSDVIFPIWEYGALFAASIAMVYVLKSVRFPGAYVFGAMLGSGILHGSGLLHATLPWWLAGAVVVMLGAVIGARFANTTVKLLVRYLSAACGSFLVAIAIAGSFLLLTAALTTADIPDLVVSFAPGAQDTMMVMALALHIDPIFVGAHQLCRYLVVTLSLPVQMRRILASRQAEPPVPESASR